MIATPPAGVTVSEDTTDHRHGRHNSEYRSRKALVTLDSIKSPPRNPISKVYDPASCIRLSKLYDVPANHVWKVGYITMVKTLGHHHAVPTTG